MVGEKELNIHREQNSEDFAKPVNDKVFKIAKELGYGKQIVIQSVTTSATTISQ